METLNFIVDWGLNKEKAWSGTKFSIYKALSKYFNVIDEEYVPFNILERVIRKIHPSMNGVSMYEIHKNRWGYRKTKGLVLQFEEILKDSENRKTYIYQDLCVDYLSQFFNTDSVIRNMQGFQEYKYEDIVSRNKCQIDYYKTCSGIFFMGKWQCEYLKNRYPELSDKIIHIGGGANIDLEGIDLHRGKAGSKLLFIGRDYVRKGGLDVIEAFKLLKPYRPNLELHFAGPRISPVTEILDGFHFYGDASKDIVQELMNECDLFCMPSYFEAYGLVFVEAMCHGLPCIGRNCCEMPFFIERGVTGELVETNAIDELAQKIDIILNNESYRKNVIARHDYYITEYSWDTVATRMALKMC